MNATDFFNLNLVQLKTDITSETTIEPNIIKTSSGNWNEWILILPLYILIFIMCVIGNVFVISTLACNKKMRTVTNIYLLNLAVSDLLLGVFCMPFTIIGQIYRRFLFGATLCRLIPFAQALSVFVDIWTLVSISMERYFAICRPLKSRKWQTLSHAYKMIFIIWMVSIIFCSPIILVSTMLPMKGNAYKCREVWPSPTLERFFSLGLDTVLLLIPFIILVFANSLIVRKLWRGMQNEIQLDLETERFMENLRCRGNILLPATPSLSESHTKSPSEKVSPHLELVMGQNNFLNLDLQFNEEFKQVVRSTHTSKSIVAKRKVIRMLFFIMIEFFMCWTPLHVMNTVYLFYPEEFFKYIGPKGVLGLQLLAFCSSCSNPVIYCFMNPKFRQAFLDLMRKCRLIRQSSTEKPESKQMTPLPSSRELTACVIRGTHTGRTDYLDGPLKEDYV